MKSSDIKVGQIYVGVIGHTKSAYLVVSDKMHYMSRDYNTLIAGSGSNGRRKGLPVISLGSIYGEEDFARIEAKAAEINLDEIVLGETTELSGLTRRLNVLLPQMFVSSFAEYKQVMVADWADKRQRAALQMQMQDAVETNRKAAAELTAPQGVKVSGDVSGLTLSGLTPAQAKALLAVLEAMQS